MNTLYKGDKDDDDDDDDDDNNNNNLVDDNTRDYKCTIALSLNPFFVNARSFGVTDSSDVESRLRLNRIVILRFTKYDCVCRTVVIWSNCR